MNHLFETYSERQHSQELLFSTQVDLMSLVVCGMYPSVHAAYQKKAVEVSVSTTALYNKLQRIELPVSRALLHETASDLQQLLHLLNVEHPSPLGKEYRLRIVDDKPRLGDSDGANFCEKSKSGGRSPQNMVRELDSITRKVIPELDFRITSS